MNQSDSSGLTKPGRKSCKSTLAEGQAWTLSDNHDRIQVQLAGTKYCMSARTCTKPWSKVDALLK